MSKKLRTLEFNDIYSLSKIIKAVNLSVMDLKIDDKTSQAQVGIEIVKMAMENLHLAKEETNEFLAELAGITPEELGKLPLEEGFELLMEFKKQEGLIDFLKRAAKLME